MAFIAVGAAALGFAGLSMYVSPGKKEAEAMAQQMFGKGLQSCTPVEKRTIDMAAGIPKLEGLRDGFQSLFPRPKPRKDKDSKSKAGRGSRSSSRAPQGAADFAAGAAEEPAEYALYEDPDVGAIYPVHEDTADPDQRYLAHLSDLKNLVPFDIETESLEDAGSYDVEEFLKANDRLPQTLTLPRQLGGAATSANLLVNKLTAGARAGLPQDYVLPGHAPGDEVHPPTDHELEGPPEEATRSLRAAVDYQLGAGRHQRGLPEGAARVLAARIMQQRERAAAAGSSDGEESSEYDDEDESAYDDDSGSGSEEEAAPAVRLAPAAAARPGARAAPAVEEYSEDEDEEEYSD